MVKDPIISPLSQEPHGQDQACAFSILTPIQPHTGQGTENKTTSERMNRVSLASSGQPFTIQLHMDPPLTLIYRMKSKFISLVLLNKAAANFSPQLVIVQETITPPPS